MSAKRILLVEDEPGLIVTLTDRLEAEGFHVASVARGDEALLRASAEPFDLVILDVMLPGKNGFDVCRELRKTGSDTPILFLTARGEVADKVVGLKLGGDDYLTKPFDMMELTARVEALLRRTVPVDASAAERYSFADVEVDFRRVEVLRKGKVIEVSALEFKLLKYFIENRGATLSRDELLRQVWGYELMPFSRTVDVHVSGLRQKIEPNPSRPQFIVTVHRLGYKFVG
ncbi:MAG TPA: response regulator transcription factor [Vicinamibacteria bacterium]|nr:response regulator transcription factor [Vicinamibacteria bacterium]